MICSNCGHDNPAAAQFCARCGSSLLQPLPPSGLPSAEPRPVEPAPVIRPKAVVNYSEGGTRFLDRVGSRSVAAVLVAVSSLAVIGWLGAQALYTVDQTQFVVVARLGEIIEVHRSPGLNLKVPFIDTVYRLDNRVLSIDVPPTSMPDVDGQFLLIDADVRYQITDPRKFIERLRDEMTASSRIRQIVIAELRNEVGLSTQAEIIGERLSGIEEAARANAAARVNAPENDFGIKIVEVRAIIRAQSDK